VNGRLRCLGSGQHLKNRFGSGYEVDIKTKLPDIYAVQTLAQYLIERGAINYSQSVSVSQSPLNHSHNSGFDEEILHIQLQSPLIDICAAMNKPERSALFTPSGDGQTIYDQLQVDGSVSLRLFLDWWIAQDYADDLCTFMNQEFENNSLLLERSTSHAFRYRITIPVDQLPLADIFEKFEANKEKLFVKDYAVGQTTLEQIFNQFASSQDNPEVEAAQLQAESNRHRGSGSGSAK